MTLDFKDTIKSKIEIYFNLSPNLNEAVDILTHSEWKLELFNFDYKIDSYFYRSTELRCFHKNTDLKWVIFLQTYPYWQNVSPSNSVSRSRQIFFDIPNKLQGSLPYFEWAVVRTLYGNKIQIPDVPTLFIHNRENFKIE